MHMPRSHAPRHATHACTFVTQKAGWRQPTPCTCRITFLIPACTLVAQKRAQRQPQQNAEHQGSYEDNFNLFKSTKAHASNRADAPFRNFSPDRPCFLKTFELHAPAGSGSSQQLRAGLATACYSALPPALPSCLPVDCRKSM
eukprot:366297-Chlamydomonas_euryale.AAC.9